MKKHRMVLTRALSMLSLALFLALSLSLALAGGCGDNKKEEAPAVSPGDGDKDKGNGDKGDGSGKGDGDKGDGDKGDGDKGDGDKGDGDKGDGNKGDGDKGDGNKGDGDKGDGNKGDGDKDNGSSSKGEDKESNVCEEAIIVALDVAKDYCGKNMTCTFCQEYAAAMEDVSGQAPEGEELKCEDKALTAAEVCLENKTLCNECAGIMLKSQCEKRPLLDLEMLRCLRFLPVLELF